MERLQRSAIVLSMIESLHKEGSWCGETHIQKSVYLLQELLGVPSKFEFILYKHGPYSFDLSDDLTAMRGMNILSIELRRPYGPSILPGPRGSQLSNLFTKTLEAYRRKTEFIARELAQYGVKDLERIATAVYVALNYKDDTDEASQAFRIHELKPHISLEMARNSLQTGIQIRGKAAELIQST